MRSAAAHFEKPRRALEKPRYGINFSPVHGVAWTMPSAQKVEDDKNGDDGGNYLDGTELAQTIPHRRVRMSVPPVFIHRGYHLRHSP
jgi:hypothetical protein